MMVYGQSRYIIDFHNMASVAWHFPLIAIALIFILNIVLCIHCVPENLPITDFTIKQILRFVGEEETSKFPILRVPSLYKDGNIESDVPDADNPILLIPGIDGNVAKASLW